MAAYSRTTYKEVFVMWKTDILFIISFWILWYGVIALLGWFTEYRKVPMWRRQSRAFFPGEMALPVMIVAVHHQAIIADKLSDFYYSPWFTALVIAGVFAIMYPIVLRDFGFYPERAAWSPTRLWHVAWGFFIIPTGIIRFAAPLAAEWLFGNIDLEPVNVWHFLGAAVFYVATILWDFYLGTQIDKRIMRRWVYARHPYNWGANYTNLLRDKEFGKDDAEDANGKPYLYGPPPVQEEDDEDSIRYQRHRHRHHADA